MRHALHIAVSILLWILFGYYWYVVVAQREVTADTLDAMGVLVGSTVLGLAVTLWWVAHNKRIASRSRRTATLPPQPEPFDRDTLGRPIQGPDLANLRRARIVDVTVDEAGAKVFAPDGEAS